MFHRAFLGPTSSRSFLTYSHLSEGWQPSWSSGLATWGEHVLEKSSGHCWPSTGHSCTCSLAPLRVLPGEKEPLFTLLPGSRDLQRTAS